MSLVEEVGGSGWTGRNVRGSWDGPRNGDSGPGFPVLGRPTTQGTTPDRTCTCCLTHNFYSLVVSDCGRLEYRMLMFLAALVDLHGYQRFALWMNDLILHCKRDRFPRS